MKSYEGGSRGVAPLIPSVLEGSVERRESPSFLTLSLDEYFPTFGGVPSSADRVRALLALLLRHSKPYEMSAAVRTYDNCSPFPHTSADLHGHCKEPKPIHLSLVCGLWPVLVAFVGLALCVYWVGGWFPRFGKTEDRYVDCQMSREGAVLSVSI